MCPRKSDDISHKALCKLPRRTSVDFEIYRINRYKVIEYNVFALYNDNITQPESLWGNYVSLRLFMRKVHNKDRISSVRCFCGNRDYTNAKRNESAIIECDYNWKFFGVPRFFEETRARSFRQDKISSTPGVTLRAELINRGHEFAPPFRFFHRFLIILHAHSSFIWF